MNKQEARKRLKELHNSCGLNIQDYEALKISLKALNKPDLIHCKDCKYWEDENRKYNQADCACKRFSKAFIDDDYKYTLEDDYCSYGEPKESEAVTSE